jgi:hypothetical protein
MSKITIDVEFLAGTDILSAITEAKEKALKWDVAYVCFKFNGTNFSIGRNADIEKVMMEWDNREDSKYGIVHS